MQTPILYVIPPTRPFVSSAANVSVVELGGIIYANSAPPPPPPSAPRQSSAISLARGIVIRI